VKQLKSARQNLCTSRRPSNKIIKFRKLKQWSRITKLRIRKQFIIYSTKLCLFKTTHSSCSNITILLGTRSTCLQHSGKELTDTTRDCPWLIKFHNVTCGTVPHNVGRLKLSQSIVTNLCILPSSQLNGSNVLTSVCQSVSIC